jgi:hypothetical protein
VAPARALDALRAALESRLPPLLARHLALVDVLAGDAMSNGAAGQVSKGLVLLNPATDGKCQSPTAGDVHHPAALPSSQSAHTATDPGAVAAVVASGRLVCRITLNHC